MYMHIHTDTQRYTHMDRHTCRYTQTYTQTHTHRNTDRHTYSFEVIHHDLQTTHYHTHTTLTER